MHYDVPRYFCLYYMVVDSEAILQRRPHPSHKTLPDLYLNHSPSSFNSLIHRPDLCHWESCGLFNQFSVDFQSQAPYTRHIETPAGYGIQVSYLGAADQDEVADIHPLAAGIAASCGSLGWLHHSCINRGSTRSSHSHPTLQRNNCSILGNKVCAC